jgi:hypothetical protein
MQPNVIHEGLQLKLYYLTFKKLFNVSLFNKKILIVFSVYQNIRRVQN